MSGGFVRANSITNLWHKVYPAYAATFYYAQTIASQGKALGALTYRGDRLYFRDAMGYLRFYNIYDDYHYWFNDVSTANIQLFIQNLRITGNIAIHNNRIYFVATELGSQKKRVHCLIEGNNGFSTVSPTWSAQFYGNGYPINVYQQVEADKELAVSPDGKRIAYIGKDGNVYYYVDPQGNGWDFAYVPLPTTINTLPSPKIKNSLQYLDNDTLFSVAPFLQGNNFDTMGRVCYFKMERAYCKNSTINIIEKAASLLYGSGKIVLDNHLQTRENVKADKNNVSLTNIGIGNISQS